MDDHDLLVQTPDPFFQRHLLVKERKKASTSSRQFAVGIFQDMRYSVAQLAERLWKHNPIFH